VEILFHKEKSDGSFERHKARLIGDGKNQQVDVDCGGETFSLVVKPVTIRTVLNLALSKAWSIHQLDVKNVFLNGELRETVLCINLWGTGIRINLIMCVC